MLEGNLGSKMNPDEERVRKALDEMFEKVEASKNSEELIELRLVLDDYLDQGYKLKCYIFRYNELVQKISNER
jgi:hypothetical protein